MASRVTTSVVSRLATAVIVVAVGLAVVAAAAAGARSPSHPKTGHYKGTTSQGEAFDFKVVRSTCAPPVRGGNQHQKKGYCFLPDAAAVNINETCPSGFVIQDTFDTFEYLLPAHGATPIRGTRSDGATSVLRLTVATNGKATGTLEQTAPHMTDSGVLEQCPSGKLMLKAKRG